jgi:ABC-type phosphate transport system substrate-binding protein
MSILNALGRLAIAACVATAAWAMAAPLSAQSIQRPSWAVAVVVHRSVAVSSLRLDELHDILLGERQHWPGRQRIVVVRPGVGPTWDAVLSRVLHMSAGGYLKALATGQYRGTIVDGPRTVESAAALRRAVAETPGALGLLALADVDTTVSVVQIDGQAPTDAEYLLRGP